MKWWQFPAYCIGCFYIGYGLVGAAIYVYTHLAPIFPLI
jgi:hypothetical protein